MAVIRSLHVGPTSVIAKGVEQAMGIAGLFITGVVGGAVLFGILRALRGRYAYLPRFVLGMAVGVPVMVISHSLSHAADVASQEILTPPPSVERISRRRFLIRLGGTTAAITVTGVVVGALSQARHVRESLVTGGERWSATHALPNAGTTVEPAPGTRAEYTALEQHYRIDINTIPAEHRWAVVAAEGNRAGG